MVAPRHPGQAASGEEEEGSAQSAGPNESGQAGDAQLEDALRKMESGELPPMQAVLEIRSIAEEYPENVQAQFTLGVMSMQTGQYEKAVDRFDKVTTLDPEYTEAHRLMARSHLALQDTARAQERFQKALRQADQNTRASIEEELAELSMNK